MRERRIRRRCLYNPARMLFQLFQVLYWLALSTWFGGAMFVAIAAPVIFRTIREYNPTLPTVLSVNLEQQHGTLLAGSIVSNLLSVLFRVQLMCAGVLVVTVIAQWFTISRSGTPLVTAILRSALLAAAIVFALYQWRVVWPKVARSRQQFIDHADEPEVANPALDEFDRYRGESETVLRLVLFVLLGLIVFSFNIAPGSVTVTFTQ